MGRAIKYTLVTVSFLFVVYLIGFAATGANLMWFKFWGPQFADAEREIFEESKSFQHGTVRELRRLQLDYERAEEGSSERHILKKTILHQAAPVQDNLPADLHSFVIQLRTEEINDEKQ